MWTLLSGLREGQGGGCPQRARTSLQSVFWVELGQNEVEQPSVFANVRKMGEGYTFLTWASLNVKYSLIVECWYLFPPVRHLERGLQ